MRLHFHTLRVLIPLLCLATSLSAQNIHLWTYLESEPATPATVVRICPDEMYIWNNHILTESGIYCDTMTLAEGMDSVACLQLEVQPSAPLSTRAIVCPGESLIWNGRNLMESGVYRDTLHNAAGCDSIVELQFSILDPLPVTMFGAAICAGTDYAWERVRYRTPGTYTRQLQSRYGCDSIIQFTLMVLDEVPSAVLDTFLFEGDTLQAGRMLLAESGVWTDTLPSWFGCDSLVHVRVTKLQGARRMLHSDDVDIALLHLPGEGVLRLTVVSERAMPVRAVLYNQKGRPMVQMHAAVRINEQMPAMNLPLEDVPPGPCFLLVETDTSQKVVRLQLEQ